MLRYIYNNIIIFGTNVIILEFLSANILILTTTMSELLKYLNEQLSVFSNVKKQK